LTGTHPLSRTLVAASQAYRGWGIKQPGELLTEHRRRKVHGHHPRRT